MWEIVDLVDDDDNVVGQIEREGYRWSHIRAVNIFLINKEWKILTPTRTMDRKNFPGHLDFSCGEHVKSGESYLQAAVRGLQEELGIIVQSTDLQLLGKVWPKEWFNIFLVFYLLPWDQEIHPSHQEGVGKAERYSYSELVKMLTSGDYLFKPDLPASYQYFSNELQAWEK